MKITFAKSLLYSASLVAASFSALRAQDQPTFEHLLQDELFQLLAHDAEPNRVFLIAYEQGDDLFDNRFNQVDGSGAKVTPGNFFTRFPRADRTGAGEWATHLPARTTGPNAQSCNECHVPPFKAAGPMAGNVHRDPLRAGNPNNYLQRNTPHLFAPGALQNLAEEMTADLSAIRGGAVSAACAGPVGNTQTRTLTTKGVGFGTISARRNSAPAGVCSITLNVGGVSGVSSDLIVRPFQWKGSVAFLRDFVRGEAHNQIGMQATELLTAGQDGDGDGVATELGVGDITGLTVFLAAQPRPTSTVELQSLGLVQPNTVDVNRINNGQTLFSSIGCAACHKPTLPLANPIFREPSQSAQYRDAVFPGTQGPPAESSLVTQFPVSFDMTQEQPENVILNPDGSVRARLGSLRTVNGVAQVDLFSDLKRHNLGTQVAEPIDETGTGASTFLTKPLWGVGSTAPYMHNGQALTLRKAIDMHGGESLTARNNFFGTAGTPVPLTEAQRGDVLAFLGNLVLFQQSAP